MAYLIGAVAVAVAAFVALTLVSNIGVVGLGIWLLLVWLCLIGFRRLTKHFGDDSVR